MHHQYLHIYRLFKIRKELGEVYINRVMQSLAISMIGVFVPIYLLNFGYSLNEVIIYLIVVYLVSSIFAPISALLNSRIGIKHTLALNFPFLMIYFGLLFSIETYNWPLSFIASSYGIALAFYWIPLNSDFAKNSDKLHRGREIGYLIAIPTIVSIAAPLIGGWIITSFNFNVLIVVVSVLLITSILALFITADYKSKLGYAWKNMFNKENLIFFKEFIAKGMLFGSFILWPLFVYSIVGNYLEVGFAVTLGALGAAIFTLLIGKLSDKMHKLKLLKIGGITNAIIWTLAIFVSTPLQVFIISFLQGLLWTLIAIPLFTAACNHANKQSVTEFMVFRFWGLCIGRILMFLVALLVVFAFKFQAVFILAALASLYFVFVKY